MAANTLLHLRIIERSPDKLSLVESAITDLGADTNAIVDGITPLMRCILDDGSDRVEIVKLLLKNNANANLGLPVDHSTALMCAVRKDAVLLKNATPDTLNTRVLENLEIVGALLNNGAQMSATTINTIFSASALSLAMQYSTATQRGEYVHSDIIWKKLLRESSTTPAETSTIQDRLNNPGITMAIELKHADEYVGRCRQNNAAVSIIIEPQRYMVLRSAANNNYLDLLGACSVPTNGSKYAWTNAFHAALTVESGKTTPLAAFKLMIKNGADPNAIFPFIGRIAVVAMTRNRFDVVELLINSGANPEAETNENPHEHTMLISSLLNQYELSVELINKIIRLTPNKLNAKEPVGGRTAAILIANHLQAYKLALSLIEAGADFRLKDKSKRDALQALRDSGKLNVDQMLDIEARVKAQNHSKRQRTGASIASLIDNAFRNPEFASSHVQTPGVSPREMECTLLLLAGAPVNCISTECSYAARLSNHIIRHHPTERVHFNPCCVQLAQCALVKLLNPYMDERHANME